MGNRTVVVTGATSGIGYEMAKELAAQGLHVVMACRNMERAEKCAQEIRQATPNDRVDIMEVDLASFASIRTFADQFLARYDRLDVLMNNAGVFCDTRQYTQDGFEMTMGVNYLGTYLLTRLLLPVVRKTPGARIINISSGAALYGKLSLDKKPFHGPHGFKAYSASKLAQVWFTISLAEELRDKGVTVNAVHPGRGATNIWNGKSLLMKTVRPIMLRVSISPAECAKTGIYVALAQELENSTGLMFAHSKMMEYNDRCLDKAAQEKLMHLSRGITGI